MKENELRELATCAWCHRGIGKSGIPLFWTLELERHMIDLAAVQRQSGLAMMLGGNGLLAGVMGPDDDMTKSVMEPLKISICDECAMGQVVVAELAERHSDKEESDEASHEG